MKQGDSPQYLRKLCLRNLDCLGLDQLVQMAERAGSPKLYRAVEVVVEQAHAEAQEYETL